MQSPLIPLESIQIASPCRAEWEQMQGNTCVRFCPSCGKNVYNLSAMTREEALRLIEKKEGSLCVRLKRRSDGTVLTNDCPIGEATRKRRGRFAQMLATAVGFVVAFVGGYKVWANHVPSPQPEQAVNLDIAETVTGFVVVPMPSPPPPSALTPS